MTIASAEQRTSRTISRSAWADRLGFFSLLLLAAVWPLTHNAAAKNIALAGMIVALVMRANEKRVWQAMKSPLFLVLAALASLAFASALWSVPPWATLDAARKHFLPLLIVFPAVMVFAGEPRRIRALLMTLIAAFCFRGFATLLEVLTTTREASLFFKGFGLEAGLYVPLALGMVLTESGWRRALSVFATVIAVTALALAGSRTGIAAALAGMMIVLAVTRRWKALLATLAGSLLVVGLVTTVKPDAGQKIAAALTPDSYVGANALSGRGFIWQGVWEIGKTRPWLGHGFGWKTLGDTAVREGFVARWQGKNDAASAAAAEYFSLPTDKVNPHNLPLQLFYEVGAVGVFLYVVVLLYFIATAWRLRPGGGPAGVLVATSLGVIGAYVIMNLTNGFWWGSSATLWVAPLLEYARRAVTVGDTD